MSFSTFILLVVVAVFAANHAQNRNSTRDESVPSCPLIFFDEDESEGLTDECSCFEFAFVPTLTLMCVQLEDPFLSLQECP
jgi:hypothetical protein